MRRKKKRSLISCYNFFLEISDDFNCKFPFLSLVDLSNLWLKHNQHKKINVFETKLLTKLTSKTT